MLTVVETFGEAAVRWSFLTLHNKLFHDQTQEKQSQRQTAPGAENKRGTHYWPNANCLLSLLDDIFFLNARHDSSCTPTLWSHKYTFHRKIKESWRSFSLHKLISFSPFYHFLSPSNIKRSHTHSRGPPMYLNWSTNPLVDQFNDISSRCVFPSLWLVFLKTLSWGADFMKLQALFPKWERGILICILIQNLAFSRQVG